MMFDIFSSFDPQQVLFSNPYMLWLMLLLIPCVITNMWTNQPFSFLVLSPLSYSCNLPSSKTSTLKGLPVVFTLVFFTILGFNWASLIPYSFGFSSHMLTTLSLALPCWTLSILSSAVNNISSFLGALLPSGAPGWLNPALLIIECVSIFVRPLTLSFRLAANLSTGHVMLTIIGTYLSLATISGSPLLFLITLTIKSGYLLFEVAIAALQAYIFVLLLTLYTNEHT